MHKSGCLTTKRLLQRRGAARLLLSSIDVVGGGEAGGSVLGVRFWNCGAVKVGLGTRLRL